MSSVGEWKQNVSEEVRVGRGLVSRIFPLMSGEV